MKQVKIGISVTFFELGIFIHINAMSAIQIDGRNAFHEKDLHRINLRLILIT
jgi:hypothetical protein